jgi:hypothetical protein
MLAISKADDPNSLEKEVSCTEAFPFSKDSLVRATNKPFLSRFFSSCKNKLNCSK